MKRIKALKLSALMALVLTMVVGCAAAPTDEEGAAEQAVANARAAVERAQDGGYASDRAVALLQQAEEAFAGGDYERAIALSNQVEQEVAANKAILDAEEAVAKADEAGVLWRDTQDLLDRAKQELANEHPAEAIQLANEARRQAENALAQAGERAGSYTVSRGDSLWTISGQAAIYGNPYQWPLIYKANQDQIRDADLIYPGQQFSIPRDVSEGEIQAAVNHARTRGSWSLGVVEDSDRAYLSR